MAEDNDFDEWLDDVETDDDGELDQLNIDALLSAVDEQPASEDSDSGDATTSELDQTNIDALLGINNASPEAPEADDDDLAELDQDNIDALLNGSDSVPAPETAENGAEELGQDNIDTLLSGDDDGELDQDNIDALLGADAIDTSELDQNAIDDLPSADELDTSELDQDNIDALLGGAGDLDTSELDQGDIDDLPSADELDTSELDQDNIDALLSGEGDLDTSELDQDNIDSLLGDADADDDIDELDQSNIDALLGGGDDSPAESGNDEIDQDNIDALLAEDSAGSDDLGDDIAQDDIDDLFAEAPPTEDTPAAVDEPSEDDIDALFNDIDAATSGESDADAVGDEQSVDELFAEEPSGDETALSAEDANAIADTAFDSEFDEMDQLFSELEDENPDDDDPFQAEEIDFAEMLDTSDGGEDEFLSLGEDDEDEFAALEPDAEPNQDGNETDIDALLLEGNAVEDKEDDDDKKGFVIPAIIADMSKTTLSAIGGTLVLLLIVGIFMLSGGDDAADSTASLQMANMEEHVNPATAPEDNFIPIVEDSMFTMADDGGELPIELQANDEDGQAINFEITRPPSYGRLSGDAPNFTYLANSNFPGEDSFEYTASDGKDTSMTAMITITGPDLKGQALAEKIAEESRKNKKIVAKEIKPKRPMVHAKNVHFYTDSTAPVTINWRRIWQEANKSDYDPKVHVEIVKAETAGSLRTTGSKTTFTPDPYSGQTDLIFYRFKKNGFRSATKTISIDIALGNPAPEINLAELKEGYPVGHNVALDASPSRDNAPKSLQFSWKQIAGTPVSMQVSPENGSHMNFVMPSSFYNKKDSGPVFRLTATDQTGQTSSKEITTKTISRRQAALWRGNNGGVEEDPALKGKYFPWPYDD